MKVFKIILLLLITFIVWMNVTPGHFRSEYCGCGTGYFTENNIKEQEDRTLSDYPKTIGEGSLNLTLTGPACPQCGVNPSWFLRLFSLVDFNK